MYVGSFVTLWERSRMAFLRIHLNSHMKRSHYTEVQCHTLPQHKNENHLPLAKRDHNEVFLPIPYERCYLVMTLKVAFVNIFVYSSSVTYYDSIETDWLWLLTFPFLVGGPWKDML